jgi:hypothetical protein
MLRRITTAIAALSLSAALRAQVPCHAENDGPNFADNTSISSVYVGIQFVASASFSATRLEVFTGETNATQSLGIWSHDAAANRPQAALASGSMQVSSTNQWYSATLGSNVALTAGQIYWFVWNANGGGQSSLDTLNSGLGQPYTPSFDGGQTWGSLFQFPDKHWKFRIYGNCFAPPQVYCTSGTSSNGCAASISASGQPSVSFANACTISIAGVEGQKSGIVFYALDQLPQPWCSLGGGTSFLCVKPPTMRTGPQGSNGTSGQCDGALVLDWNAFQLANPGALGAPWSAGDDVYVQGWYRDPPSCKTTSLSNAVQLTYQP